MSFASPTSGGTSHVLPAERAKCSFDIASLELLMNPGRTPQKTKIVEEARAEIFKGAPFDNEDMKDYYSYEDKFVKTLERTAATVNAMRDPNNRKFLMLHQTGQAPMGDMFQIGSVGGLHFSMFLTFIKTNANQEQKDIWLEPAQEARMFGAYAQTELGHGSNVRGLETTATFDRQMDEIVIHSPTLSSLKWWPTGMYACTHGVVFAQLIVDGKNLGFHGFMVQFRDDEGNLMPGVEIGEMGPKINADNTNIGYARFTQVRIPRFNMFAKYQQLSREGEYIAPPRQLSKFRYISMMQIRMFIVHQSFRDLAMASTIAIRYSCVRKQGFRDTTAEDPLGLNIGENAIIDYKMQQYRVFKAMATAYCFYWSARWVSSFLNRVQETVERGTDAERNAAADELPELHASLSALKVWSTLWAHTGIEDLRKSCGGQGYLRSSGICDLSMNFAEPATVEGEQVIMSLQVARYLIKACADAAQGKALVGSVQYLLDPEMGKVQVASFRGQTDLLVNLMKDRANRMAKRLATRFNQQTAKGLPFDHALNSVAIEAYKAAECHAAYTFAKMNAGALADYVKEPSLKAALGRLLDLVCLVQLREHSGDWKNALDSDMDDVVGESITDLLDEIRPDAVGLVDGFGFSDYNLQSTLGRYDGDVYEAIYNEAKKSPLNQTPKMVGWEQLGPCFDKEFLRMGMRSQRAGNDKPMLGNLDVVVSDASTSSMAPAAVSSKL